MWLCNQRLCDLTQCYSTSLTQYSVGHWASLRLAALYWYSQRRRSHDAHYTLCVGHQVLRGHHKIGTKKNPHSYNNYNSDIISV